VKREKWNPAPPNVDIEKGLFFTANSITELANKVVMKYQPKGIPADALQNTVAKYNSFVDAGKDADFGKPTPKYKIQTAPFYAAWAVPVMHDAPSRAVLPGSMRLPKNLRPQTDKATELSSGLEEEDQPYLP
jgi:hypothetical protein